MRPRAFAEARIRHFRRVVFDGGLARKSSCFYRVDANETRRSPKRSAASRACAFSDKAFKTPANIRVFLPMAGSVQSQSI